MFASSRPYGPVLVPGSPVKLRGAVILQAPGQWPYWAQFWRDWDWPTISRTIDMLAALGINCLQVTATGLDDNEVTHPTDAVMASRIGQLATYAATHRMVLNPQLGYQPAHSFRNGAAVCSAAAARMASIFAQQPNIAFIDVLNEVNYYPAAGWGPLPNVQSGSDLSTLIASIRAVTRSIPLTLSVGCVSRGDISGPWMSAVAPLCDFHNVHSYFYQQGGLSAPASSDFAALRSASWYLGRFVVGETGMPAQNGAAAQTTWLTGCGVIASAADCLGSIIWAATDTSAAPGRTENVSSFGLADSTGTTVRSALSQPVQNWPATL
jgi:hypothetical protein